MNMDFKNISKEYRPVPFWSWNDKLEVEETKEQIKAMHLAGMGGFFMHARGGLQTEYMGEEWFDNVAASIEEAANFGMRPWAYDENGWPSGFGNGIVNGLGVEYQQKYLRMESRKEHDETAICKCGEHYFYYDINPFYVDNLDAKVVEKFIEVAYLPYYEKYGTKIEGFFTDEPQISRMGFPWSFVFEEEYEKRYQENILDKLEQLFLPIGDYKRTRVKFWKMVTELFSVSYMKQIYDWCEKRGLKLTGHLLLEDGLAEQLITNGACMPHYEYMTIPGMDWLGREIRSCPTPLQVSTVAEQLGKEAVLSETFAMCGHNVSFDELKGVYEWQMVHGVTLMCQHLEGYSIRGIRKRDYPPAMYYQQPWWQEYNRFIESMSRVGKILSDGYHPVDVLLIHPQTTAWSMYDATDIEDILKLNDRFMEIVRTLEEKHIAFHFGDEIILERHGKVQDDKLIVGNYCYSYVIQTGCELLLDNTEKLLTEFERNGGKIVSEEELPDNPVIDSKNISYTRRDYDDFSVHYYVNTSAERIAANIPIRGKVMDIYTGDTELFHGTYEFEPWGSLLLIEDGEEYEQVQEAEPTYIYPDEELEIIKSDYNSLTLDKCDYYFDGVLQEKQGYVLNIAERANELERKVQIHQDYHVQMEDIPEQLYLVCETPEKFCISVNGRKVTQTPEGHFMDKSFQKIDITEYVILGENVISFDCNFEQSEQFYQNRRKARIFESEKNKLVYDMEIEAVYLLGDFRVRTEGQWRNLDKDAVRYDGAFVIEKTQKKIHRKNIEKQGYPFFCGSMTLSGKIDIHGENPMLLVNRKGINVWKIEINGIEKVMITGNKISLKEFGVQGTVPIQYTLINNLRNLLGPHHLKEGETYLAMPQSFFKESCIWNEHPENDWDDTYCFVEMGI